MSHESQITPEMNDVFQSVQHSLRNYLRRHVNETVVDDLLQEVFVKIHSRMDTLKDIRRLNGWIYQIARNAIIDYYRSKKAAAELPETITSLEI